jgi:hypothetical protein
MVILFLLGSRLFQDNGISIKTELPLSWKSYYLIKTELPLFWKSLLPNKNRIIIVLEDPTT